MLLSLTLSLGFLLARAEAQSSSSLVVLSGIGSATSTDGFPTGTFLPPSSTRILASDTSGLGTMTNSESTIGTGNATSSTTTATRTELRGTSRETTTTALNGTASASGHSTASSTSSSAQPTNTTPCNGYAELCNRKYSNITNVMAHNSPFVGGGAADNQDLPVTTQLNDGIRGLQAQVHIENGTVYLCHTTCDLLNAGTLTSYLTTVNTWVQSHPYDVITILIGNADYNPVTDYVSAFEDSGIVQYAYVPPKEPMGLDDWPTLGSMILTGKRVVVFMDYQANQTQVPWIMVEFEQMWETPFDPTDRNFPCTVQRPPDLSPNDRDNRLYLMNHNLNQNITLLSISLSVPNKPLLPQTNNVTGFGSLGLAANNCALAWGRPPTFLDVDYYNNGSGTVFEVAAKWNNVTYTGRCCGLVASGAEKTLEIIGRSTISMVVVAIFSAWMLI